MNPQTPYITKIYRGKLNAPPHLVSLGVGIVPRFLRMLVGHPTIWTMWPTIARFSHMSIGK